MSGFGFAAPAADATPTDTVFGTAKYLSPEQVKGDRVDGRSDLYSLGVVMFEALTGRAPFRGNTDAATALPRLAEEPPKVASIRRNVPPELGAMVDRLMERAVGSRFQSAEEVLATLSRVDPTAHETKPRAEMESATSSADLAPDVEIPASVTNPEMDEARDLIGQYERLLSQVDAALDKTLWKHDPITEANVESNRRNLRQNLYESPGEIDLILTKALANNLSRQLINAIVPSADVQELAHSLLSVGDPDDAVTQLYGPADALAEMSEFVGKVPIGRNRFAWTIETLGWTFEHPVVTGAGSAFTTIGNSAAAALGADAAVAGLVGVIAGLTAATLAHAGAQYRRKLRAYD